MTKFIIETRQQAHTMPWTAMALALGLAVILFFAEFKVVRRREY
jgi:hypothetical protein